MSRKRSRPDDPLVDILRPRKKKARTRAEKEAECTAVARAEANDVKLPAVLCGNTERAELYDKLGIRGRIPAGWRSHPGNISKPWELKRGVLLVVGKTPLSRAFDRQLPREEWWRPAMLSLLSYGKVSDVIDATFTKRYYHPLELPPPIDHHKLMFAGGDTAPSPVFLRNADELIHGLVAKRSLEAAEDGETRVIVVHCTHGVNRSGFLATRWLCQFLGWDGQKALDEFERLRGVAIYREALRKALLAEFPAAADVSAAGPGGSE